MLDLHASLTLLAIGVFLSVTGTLLAILWGRLMRPQTFGKDEIVFLAKLFGAMGLLPLILGIVMKL